MYKFLSTTQKRIDFVREPIKDKPIIAIAGVGDKAVAILEEHGYNYAYQLLGQFLLLNKNETAFDVWLQSEVTAMNSKHRSDCIECLKKWCENNL